MDAFNKKLLAGLMAIVMIAAAFTGFVMMGTTQAVSLPCPLNEDFSGSWLPTGWTQEEYGEWIQWDSDYAEGTSPEADLCWDGIYGDYAYLDSKPVDTTSATSLTLEFKSFIDDYCCSEGWDEPECDYGGDCGSYDCKVYTRANGSDSWTDVTPWSNPIYGSVGPDTYSIDISSDIGSATQVRFEFDGYYYAIDDWYVDDVKICSDGGCQDEPSPEVGFASLIAEGKLVILYNFDPFTTVPTAVAGWTWYDPELPPAQNNLDQLYLITAYWVKVTEECWLTYGTQTYHFAAGWNNPVWKGC